MVVGLAHSIARLWTRLYENSDLQHLERISLAVDRQKYTK